ncbi:MAG: glycosyltransferase family 2 protein [Dehalococcoidia bacterium]|nr:glycosyltransferase family 2 protein [Dehalococcoidia bacterium]
MWRAKSVSVVFPTYNEKDSIRSAVEDFFATGIVDEVIVVNNNAAEGTDEAVQGTGALLIHEPRQGYGYSIQCGLEASSGDYIIISEPDGTFYGRDTLKLLAYSEDCDVVYGTRTHREFIWAGANMGWGLKWGNYVVAKLVEVLFNTSTLSDVGCTMRLISRSALQQMQPHFTVGGSAFGLEMMLISFILRQRIVQVPMNYTKRVGISSVTGIPIKTVELALRMVWLILDYRIRSFLGRHSACALASRPARRGSE